LIVVKIIYILNKTVDAAILFTFSVEAKHRGADGFTKIVSSTWLCLAVKEAPCAKAYLKDFEVILLFQIKWNDLLVGSTDFGFR